MRYVHKYPRLTPEQPTEDWRRNWSKVQGADNLKSLFDRARDLGYYPFRTWVWKDEEWYISNDSSPPALFLTGEEAANFTMKELMAFFDRTRAEWEFIPHPATEENGWRDWREALVRAESLLSLLHHRGLVDSENNREDVKEVLKLVREALAER